jgi:hypothetical protein
MPDQDEAAASYLDQATQRSGGRQDSLITAMRKHWKLPAKSATPAAAPAPKEELNK